MNIIVFACLIGLSVASAVPKDVVWMEILSAQVMDAVEDDNTVVDKAEELGLTDLVALVKKAGLEDTLRGAGPFTVFGPTNEAFKHLNPYVVKLLLKNTTLLAELLEYHVAGGKVMAEDLSNDELIESVLGPNIRINIYKNGTVVTANGRRVVKVNQNADNGVIHEVDRVLFPPAGSFVDFVSKCPVFRTLLKAVQTADLVDALSGDGNLTLFAPTNCAFDKIPKECLDRLLANVTLLKSVLTYHVVGATAYSAGLTCGEDVPTLNGATVHITKCWRGVRVNHAKVIKADLTFTTGAVHVIDEVLLPKELDGFCDMDVEENNEKELKSDYPNFEQYLLGL